MNIYYCNECASRNGHVSIVDTETLNLTGSDYLFDKFEKHTQLPIGSGFTSIFDGSTYSDYLNYSLSALDLGYWSSILFSSVLLFVFAILAGLWERKFFQRILQ